MSISDPFTDRLSEYLDGELAHGERAALEAHLGSCAGCRATLAELREVMATARELRPTPPARDLWAGVAARIGSFPRAARVSPFGRVLSARRFSFTLPEIAAACLALMVLSGGLVWMARSGDPRADFDPVSASEPATVVTPANFADSHFDEAVADLERTLQAGRSKLHPETVRVLEENLAAIDRAIEQSKRALAADPANIYLNTHLAQARQRKLALLRRASALTGL